MKKALTISLLTVLLFIVLTLITANIETPVDGNDTFGFPLTFYMRYGSECDPCPPNEMKYWKLMIDIGFSLIGGLLIWKTIHVIKNRIKKPGI